MEVEAKSSRRPPICRETAKVVMFGDGGVAFECVGWISVDTLRRQRRAGLPTMRRLWGAHERRVVDCRGKGLCRLTAMVCLSHLEAVSFQILPPLPPKTEVLS